MDVALIDFGEKVYTHLVSKDLCLDQDRTLIIQNILKLLSRTRFSCKHTALLKDALRLGRVLLFFSWLSYKVFLEGIPEHVV